MREGLRGIVIGAAAFVLLHLQYVVLWPSIYARYPWSGYESAMQRGLIEPAFTESPRALVVMRASFFVLAIIVA